MSKVKSKVDVMYSIRITQELEALIMQVAEKEGRTKTNVIRHYLELGLRVAGKTQQLDTPVINVVPSYSLPIQSLDRISDKEGLFHIPV